MRGDHDLLGSYGFQRHGGEVFEQRWTLTLLAQAFAWLRGQATPARPAGSIA